MKIIQKIKEEITWFFSPKVREAINEGKSYDEVKSIAEKEAR